MCDLELIMPEMGCTSSSTSGKILTIFERDILAQVDKFRRWNVIDGRCYFVYGLSMEGRSKFIPECILDDFKCLDKFAIRAFDCHSSKELIHSCQHLFDRGFKEASVASGISLQNDNECEAFIIGRENDKGNSTELYITVDDRSGLVSGKKMILTNAGKHNASPFPKDKGVIFESRLGGKDIWLKPSESIVLQFEVENEKRVWREVGKSISHNVCFDANPLARQSGPVLQYSENGNSNGVDYKLDGELFLPINVIDKLLQSKINSTNKPFFQWICTRCDLEIEAFLEITKIAVKDKKEEMLVCMVYEHLPEHHTLAATLYVKIDKVYCYLHETLGSENKLARKIRNKLLETIKSSFCDHSIVCIFPKEAMQKDFSVCGVFAMKIIKYVSKNPKQWASFIEELGVPKTHLETRWVQVKKLPAELLKMCQDITLASPKQKNYPVGHKGCWNLTLEQYWAAYGYRNKRGSNNHAALAKLYKYYADYAALKEKAGKRKVKVEDCVQMLGSRAAGKRSLRNYDNSLYQPDPKKEKIRDTLTGQSVYVSVEKS